MKRNKWPLFVRKSLSNNYSVVLPSSIDWAWHWARRSTTKRSMYSRPYTVSLFCFDSNHYFCLISAPLLLTFQKALTDVYMIWKCFSKLCTVFLIRSNCKPYGFNACFRFSVWLFILSFKLGHYQFTVWIANSTNWREKNKKKQRWHTSEVNMEAPVVRLHPWFISGCLLAVTPHGHYQTGGSSSFY